MDGEELWNLLSEGELKIPSVEVFSALQAILPPLSWTFDDRGYLYLSAFRGALKDQKLRSVISDDIASYIESH
jgi:hypothetical protein